MKYKLFNYGWLPRLEGAYFIRRLSFDEFIEKIQSAKSITSYLNNQLEAELIGLWTDWDIPLSFEEPKLDDDDWILIFRTSVDKLSPIGQKPQRGEGYEFALMHYQRWPFM